MSTGVLVLGHGSRREVGEANQTVVQIAEKLREAMDLQLMEVAFMNEKSGLPGLGPAVDRLVERGATHIVVLPVFLAAGMHLRRDIPADIDLARQRYPAMKIVLAEHIGADPRLVTILAERLTGAMKSNGFNG